MLLGLRAFFLQIKLLLLLVFVVGGFTSMLNRPISFNALPLIFLLTRQYFCEARIRFRNKNE
jgi:hypothetical protein